MARPADLMRCDTLRSEKLECTGSADMVGWREEQTERTKAKDFIVPLISAIAA